MVFSFFEEHSGLSWFIVAVGAVGIFILSSLTFGPATGGTNFFAILYHVSSFFFLGLFLFMAVVRGHLGRGSFLLFLAAFLLAMGYGLSDEIHQFFVPGRSCALFDVFLDGVGVVFASLVYGVRLVWKTKNL
tara:strand:+ start:290 stop:685 length:396 start_codon:yes stop_codon:yes gene_type:complete